MGTTGKKDVTRNKGSRGLQGPTQPDMARGPGLVSQIMFGVRAGFGPGSNYNNETLYRTFRAFSGHYFFAKQKLFLAALILYIYMHIRAPETNYTDLIFSGIFVANPSQLTDSAPDIFVPFLKS
jgi:hypothetical protein